MDRMRLLQWRARTTATPSSRAAFIRFPALGDPVGRARYIPGDAGKLNPQLRRVIGKVIELQFAGMADRGPLAGQSLYAEVPGQEMLGGALIPEEDLDFLDRRED
jgi:hypothetical protein